MKQGIWLALFSLGLLFTSCIKPPEYPDTPEIEFVGLSKNIVNQRNTQLDTVALFFSFTDGDGDLSSDTFDLFIRDSRLEITDSFRIPPIPREGAANGISGEFTVLINNQVGLCCIPPNGAPPCLPNEEFPSDTMSYFISIMDRAKNVSNTIETSPIVILCN